MPRGAFIELLLDAPRGARGCPDPAVTISETFLGYRGRFGVSRSDGVGQHLPDRSHPAIALRCRAIRRPTARRDRFVTLCSAANALADPTIGLLVTVLMPLLAVDAGQPVEQSTRLLRDRSCSLLNPGQLPLQGVGSEVKDCSGEDDQPKGE